MSNRQKSLSSGPKTEEGKAVSAQNARKDSIFVKGYLPWEDRATKQKQFAEMVAQWGAHDPSRLALLRIIEQANLSIERIMYVTRLKLEGAMQSVQIAFDFCKHAGISVLRAENLPHWFFVQEGETQKRYALLLAQIYDEADDLKENYSDQLVGRIEQEYPCLYDYVMGDQPRKQSFLLKLGERFKQSTPTMNLVALMNEINEKHPDHLLWAQAPERYQTIIDSIRGDQMEAMLTNDKTQRYIATAQNQILKAFAGLASLDQHERWRKVPRAEALAEPITVVELAATTVGKT